MDHTLQRPLLARILLIYLAFQSAQIGFWALFAPQSFYDGFPGLGRTWIAVDGPYNEHLTRDFGALNLALLVVLGAAIITLSHQLIVTASLASMTWGVPHLIYHLFNTDGLTGSDIAASIIGLAIFAVLPILAIWLSSQRNPAPTQTSELSNA